MILVTGATGNVGRPLVDELVRAGRKVRALTRDPATAGLPGEVEVAPTAEPPLDGVTSIFLNPAVFWNGLGELLDRAVEHRVRRIVLLSSIAAVNGDAPGNVIGAHHLEVEREIEASGLEWAFVRPGMFATNTLRWAGPIRENGVVRGPYAGSHSNPIHERDVAAVAARALLGDDLVGTRPPLTGPESLTNADLARTIGEAVGRPVRYEELTPEAAREAMTGGHATPAIVDALLRMQAETVGRPVEVSPEVERITGRRGLTFAEWAADHAADFK